MIFPALKAMLECLTTWYKGGFPMNIWFGIHGDCKSAWKESEDATHLKYEAFKGIYAACCRRDC